MVFLFVALFLFFAIRAFLYFQNGRAFAGIFSILACLLFAGAIYADFAKQTNVNQDAAQSAT